MSWKFWKKGKEKEIDPATLPGQRWHIKRRGPDGRLNSIDTLDHPPTEGELSSMGEGSYLIFTVRPHFRKFNSVTILPSPVAKNIKKMEISKWTPPVEDVIQEDNENKSQQKELLYKADPQSPPSIAQPTIQTIDQDQAETSSNDSSLDEFWAQFPCCPHCAGMILPRHGQDECTYCNQLFHIYCYQQHNCSKSFICPGCDERHPNTDEDWMEYCNQLFCSPRCIDKCHLKNKWKVDCKACNGSMDLYSENDDEENGEDLIEFEEN